MHHHRSAPIVNSRPSNSVTPQRGSTRGRKSGAYQGSRSPPVRRWNREPIRGRGHRGGQVNQRSSERRTWCNWCGRSGHEETNCWERQGVCQTCGGAEHESSNCPRRIYQNRKVNCPTCGGPHLGRQCHEIRSRNLNC